MIQLDVGVGVEQKNPTPTSSVVRNPTPTPPENLRLLTTPAPQPCIKSCLTNLLIRIHPGWSYPKRTSQWRHLCPVLHLVLTYWLF